MDRLLDLGGAWLARAYAFYGLAFLLPTTFFFANLALLGAVTWAAISHARGRRPWPRVPDVVRRWGRLAVEFAYGFVNPLLYLAVLALSLPELPLAVALLVLRLCPLYLVPAVLLWDHTRSMSTPGGPGRDGLGVFLLPGRAARVAVAGTGAVALLTFALAAHRRSEASVRRLVHEHRGSIREAAARHDVDPRLLAAIVYVTHRDQLSPFRDALERVVVSAWALNLRGELGFNPPDRLDEIGTDENPLLNRSLDVSVGLAQVKPRTAQTASVLATGSTPDELPRPAFYSYRGVEPTGEAWALPARPDVRRLADPGACPPARRGPRAPE